MGYVISRTGFESVIEKLGQQYRLYAPVRKVGEGRYTDVDVVRYDFVTKFDEIELEAKSDYAFKELLTPLSQTFWRNMMNRPARTPRRSSAGCRSTSLSPIPSACPPTNSAG